MSLTQRERLVLHMTQLANSKSHDKLEMHLGSAINIIINKRCRSLTYEEIGRILKDVQEELNLSSTVYDEYDIK